MRTLLLSIFALISATSYAAVDPHYQDIKLPTQQMIEKQSWVDLATASSTAQLNGVALTQTQAAYSITSFSAQPAVARNLKLQFSAPNYNNINGGDVVVTGLDYLGHSLSETFTVAAHLSTAVTGSKAFASVSSVAIPAAFLNSSYGVNIDLGTGVKIGVKRCMTDAGNLLHAAMDGSKEATAPTMTTDASVVALNTASFNTAPNAAHDYDLYFIQNFRCVR
jgi:hypothetical protein